MGKRDERRQAESEAMEFLLQRTGEIRQQYEDNRNRRAVNAVAQDGVFLQDLEKVLKRVFAGKALPASGYATKKSQKPKQRIANVAFSDLHFHSLLDPREVPLAYGPQEEARRFGKVVQEACDYKPQYRDNTELYVHVFGDIIQGNLHDPRDAATLTMQFGAASYYLTQAALAFSKDFPKVTFRCVPGNHGRNKQRHPDRAVSQKFDSFENMVYLSFKHAVASLPNVKVEIPYTPYYAFKAFDQKGFVTHGDTVLDVGFPSDTINIQKIRNQINEWNAGDETYDLFVVGHVHCGSIVHIPSGPVFMSNGCLVPPDPYAISRGRAKTNCGQWVFESVPGHIVGDARFINVNEETDKEPLYERIIKPFVGFETESPLKKR